MLRWLQRLVARPKPRPAAPDARFGYALLGLGHGAHKFLHALRNSPTTHVTALISGDPARATKLARKHRIPAVYTYADLPRIAGDPRIQAVYLAVPTALHLPFTVAAALAGKHVLCEKPLAPTDDDCRAMIAAFQPTACRDANRLLAVGYRLPFTTVHTRAREILASGTLGRIESVRSTFGFRAKPGWRLDPALAGGGSLYDVGLYSVRTLRDLLPGPLTIAAAHATRDPDTGLELDIRWQATLGNGIAVECRSSFLEKLPDAFEVRTERATLTLAPAFSYSGLRLTVRAHNEIDRNALDLTLETPKDEPSSFRLEAEYLAHCALTGTPLRNPAEQGLEDIETLEEIYRLAGLYSRHP